MIMEEVLKELRVQNKLLALIHAFQRGQRYDFTLNEYETPKRIEENAERLLMSVYSDNSSLESSS